VLTGYTWCHLFAGCTSHLTDVTIEPDGSFYPCGYLTRVEGLKAGKSSEDDVAKAWKKSLAVKRFTSARLHLPRECYPCSQALRCRGSCVAEAYLGRHGLYAAKPNCTRLKVLNHKKFGVETGISCKEASLSDLFRG